MTWNSGDILGRDTQSQEQPQAKLWKSYVSLGASIPEAPTLSFQHPLLPPGTWQSPWIPKVTPPSTAHTESHKSKRPTKRGLYPRSVSTLKVFREWQRQTNETVKIPQWGFSKAGTERPRSSQHFHTNYCWSTEEPCCSTSEPRGHSAHRASPVSSVPGSVGDLGDVWRGHPNPSPQAASSLFVVGRGEG